MRNFETLDSSRVNPDGEILEFFRGITDSITQLAIHREGVYVAISASYGPLEIALRPRYDDMARTLSRLTSIEGLQTSRQIGTGQAYLAVGLGSVDDLLIRLTIVADATGHVSINIRLTAECRAALYQWLSIEEAVRLE